MARLVMGTDGLYAVHVRAVGRRTLTQEARFVEMRGCFQGGAIACALAGLAAMRGASLGRGLGR
jgi:hypothetical protein